MSQLARSELCTVRSIHFEALLLSALEVPGGLILFKSAR